MAAIGLNINASLVGFSYFIPQNVALGLCFFYLLNTVQRGLWSILGWGDKEAAIRWVMPAMADVVPVPSTKTRFRLKPSSPVLSRVLTMSLF